MEAYLFVHFSHPEITEDAEQIYFAVSIDGMKWQALNNGKPVLKSNMGEKGVRDPYIIRSPRGDGFYLIATDLSIYFNNDWERAQTNASKSLMIWESKDLINWSEQRMVKVAVDDAGCAWAPECAYDYDTGDFMVFWASRVGRDNYQKQRIYSSRTFDFIHFTKPEVYIERKSDVIDTTIIEYDGKYYRFSKDETVTSIIMEVGEKITGEFKPVDSFSLINIQGYEGPICFKFNGQNKWCLLLDAYSTGQGYIPFITDDIKTGNFILNDKDFITPYKFRHGSVIPITMIEYNALVKAYSG